MTILVVGEALVDVVERNGQEPSPHAGGSPFNVAVGLARLNVPTRLAAQLAPDAYGELLRARLDESGVVLDALEPVPARTSSARATLAADGSASYVFDLTWDPATLPDAADFDAVHVGSLGTSLQPGASAVTALVTRAHERDRPVSYDPNIRVSVEPDVQVWRQAFADVSPHACLIKMSDEDAEVLFPGVEPAEIIRLLTSDSTNRLVAITRGGEGVVIGIHDGIHSIEAPPVEVADTIGAGDSFMAALIAGLSWRDWPQAGALSADDLIDLGTYAARAAAITCSRSGADPPRTAEL